MGRIARACCHIVGVSLVMLAWSELVFFNEDVALSLLEAMAGGILPGILAVLDLFLFYLIPGLALVGLIAVFPAMDLARIMLTGALIGIVIEGAVVPAIHEAPPISWLWTAVAWHAPVTVGVGIFLVPRLMRTPRRGVAGLIALGVAWGLWSPWVNVDGADLLDLDLFARHAFVTMLVMTVGYGIMAFGQSVNGTLFAVLGTPALALFILQTFTHLPLSLGPVVLVIGLAWLLHRLGAAESGAAHSAPSIPGLCILPIAPLCAVATFAAGDMGLRVAPSELPPLAMLAGMIFWLWAVIRGLRRRD